MNVQTADHRSPGFAALLAPLLGRSQDGLQDGVRAGRFLFPASGTGRMGSGNCQHAFPRRQGPRRPLRDMFSDRWIDLCRRHGHGGSRRSSANGATGAPADRLGARLRMPTGRREIKAVLVTHNETATGVRSDIAAVRRAMDVMRPPGDALRGLRLLAGLDGFPHGRMGRGCRRYQLPERLHAGDRHGDPGRQPEGASRPPGRPGLSPARSSISARWLAANAAGRLSLHAAAAAYARPARESLDMLFEEGLDNVFARHRRIAEGVRQAVRAWGLELCARSPELYSDTVSAIRVPEGFDAEALTDHLSARPMPSRSAWVWARWPARSSGSAISAR